VIQQPFRQTASDASSSHRPATHSAKDLAGNFIFVTTCVDAYLNGSYGEAIHEMKSRGDLLDWDDLVRAVGMEHLASVFTDAAGLKDDFGVTWQKSIWRDIPCVYVVHSGIEHIFTLNGQVPDSEYQPEDDDD
jgi:hypothetical protein